MVSLYGPRRRRRRRFRPWKNGGAWGKREERSSPPKSMLGVEGSRFALRWSGADGDGGSEGGETGPSTPLPGIEWSHSLGSR